MRDPEFVKRAIEPVLEAEEAPSPEEMADAAAYSRFHFHRIFKSVMGETPGELRRRLLLERAAFSVSNGVASATEIAFEAGYESLEGFIRSFRRAFGVSPGAFRKSGLHWLLHAPNDVHFRPISDLVPGGKMDLLDRLLEHDLWLTRRLLECARNLDDARLDAPLATPSRPISFEPWQRSLRDLLDRIVFGKEVWVAALEHQGLPEERDKSVDGMLRRLEIAYPMFIGLARRVRDQEQWDLTFVDELCEPPETFTFGGMISHVVTFGTYRRGLAVEALKSLGIDELGYGDPIQWEREVRG
ncbi:MAG TPA: helix-turn-helix domain-containing protein [Fimbriimonadaceae bacterium]|nr:helix-turn-helix domain-containing protein [Fimbriimonadaceae bacterium]